MCSSNISLKKALLHWKGGKGEGREEREGECAPPMFINAPLNCLLLATRLPTYSGTSLVQRINFGQMTFVKPPMTHMGENMTLTRVYKVNH